MGNGEQHQLLDMRDASSCGDHGHSKVEDTAFTWQQSELVTACFAPCFGSMIAARNFPAIFLGSAAYSGCT